MFRFQSLPSTIFVIPRRSESIQSSASLPRGSLAVLHCFYSSFTRIAWQYGKFTSDEKEKLRTPGIAAKGLHGLTAKAGQGPPALSFEVVNLQILSWKNWKHKTCPTSGWGGCFSENTGGVRGGKQRDRPFRRRTRTKAASRVPSARLCPSRPGRRSPEERRRWRGAPQDRSGYPGSLTEPGGAGSGTPFPPQPPSPLATGQLAPNGREGRGGEGREEAARGGGCASLTSRGPAVAAELPLCRPVSAVPCAPNLGFLLGCCLASIRCAFPACGGSGRWGKRAGPPPPPPPPPPVAFFARCATLR